MDTEQIAAARKLAAEARERQQFPWVDPFAIRLAEEINQLAAALEQARAERDDVFGYLRGVVFAGGTPDDDFNRQIVSYLRSHHEIDGGPK